MEAYRAGSGANSKKRRSWNKWHWTRKEDELLTELVKRHGPGNWNYIADHIRGRTGMSCRLRWVNHLNPKVDKTPFSEEEQGRLLELHRDFGNKWSAIVSFFPGRTDNQLKNQYHALVGSRNMKVTSSSSSTHRRGCLNIGSIDVSLYVSLPNIEVGSQFSDVNKCGGCAPCLNSMPDKTKMPLFIGGSSSQFSNVNKCGGCAPCLNSMPDKTKMPLFNGGSSSQISNVNKCGGCAPYLNSMPDTTKMPLFNGGSSSIYGRDETWFARCSNLSRNGSHSFESVNLGNIYANLRTSHGDSMMSDARSAAISELCPVAQPQEGVSVKNYQFIDFLGVGNSE
ncbi:hypothetical protein Pfo_019030 [Paulownia fortunei]|nr:hypothetical protein Pfo_019030 [Paulownia fortunei]